MLRSPSNDAHGEGGLRLREGVHDAANRVVAGIEREVHLTQDRRKRRHHKQFDQSAAQAGVRAEAERHERSRLVMLVTRCVVAVDVEGVRLREVLRQEVADRDSDQHGLTLAGPHSRRS